jgi:threonylcarbamoyladenosine tRNA methylthiotransferase MtaB
MGKKSVHFETLGCKLNQVESEAAARSFADAGFAVSMEPWTALCEEDKNIVICVVNTCTVTSKAEQKARRVIRLLLSKCPAAAVVVTGCYAELDKELIRAIDPRVAVLGGQHKYLISQVPAVIVKETVQGKNLAQKLQALFDEEIATKKAAAFEQKTDANKNEHNKIVVAPAFMLSTDTFISHSRSSIKIQDGCDNACTYCRIHFARGKAVSLDVQSVLDRVHALEYAGQNEVVFTTVNIAQYRGAWKDGYTDFAGLLRILLDQTHHISFRISSLYPEIVNEDLCTLIASPRVRPHFHLSVQSGSDRILSLMKRPYRSDAVRHAVELLRVAKKNPFFACDIIAGFPGETDEDFAQTMKLMHDCGFAWIHAFPFSARPGTPAYAMRPMVPNSVAGERVAQLESFAKKSRDAYINSYKGTELPAICESVHRPKILHDTVIVHAVTENFLHCQMTFDAGSQQIPQAGSVISVQILGPVPESEKTGESDTKAVFTKVV